MSAEIQTTTADKLSLLPLIARDLASLFIRLISHPFVGGAKANDLFKDVVYAALRTNLTNISPGAEQWVNKSTEAEYLTFAKSKGFQPDTDVLGSGLKVHWLGRKTAEKVLLYFHGGTYPNSWSWRCRFSCFVLLTCFSRRLRSLLDARPFRLAVQSTRGALQDHEYRRRHRVVHSRSACSVSGAATTRGGVFGMVDQQPEQEAE